MKKILKVISLVLCLVFVLGLFSACSDKPASKTSSAYTYWASLDSRAAQTITSYNEMLYYQEVCKATGIDVEFIHPASGSTGAEAFQILLSSGNYPDIIEYNWTKYAGGPDVAIADNVIIALNDYIKDYAPNYYDYMEGEKGKANDYLYRAQALTNGGNYYGFNALCIGNYRGTSGFYVRKDKLDEWNLDVPATIDDWENLFKTAKANGFTTPFVGTSTTFGFSSGNQFNIAWRVGKNFYLDGDTVKFGPNEKAYKDYVAKMAEWVKLGYVDKDYVTNTNIEVEGYMTSGKSVACYGYVGSGIGKLLPAMAEKDPKFDLVACPFPVLKDGETPWAQEMQSEVIPAYTAAISTQCGAEDEDRYKGAMAWLDYLYSDEGMILKFFGVEGDTYTTEIGEDGETHYVYTDKIYDHEKLGAHSIEAVLYKFMRPGGGPGFSDHPDYLNGFYSYEQQKDAIKVWNANLEEARKHILPPLTYTTEEAAKIANIQASERENLNAVISNIILGKASLDTLDSAVKSAMENGYAEYLKIQQEAYDRYKKSL